MTTSMRNCTNGGIILQIPSGVPVLIPNR